MAFYGEHVHNLDGKGRIILPSRFRDGLGPQVTVQKGVDRCVLLIPPQEWARLEEQVRGLPQASAEARRYRRFFFSQASVERIDAQGRLLVPQPLREYAGLTREVVVAGAGAVVELWDQQAWDTERSGFEDAAVDISAGLPI